MNDNKSRDIFYGVVAIATLIVALVGATLAYFSISASSSEGAVGAKAAVVSIEYNDGQQVSAQADKLIPASYEVVKKVYERNRANFTDEGEPEMNVCLDDNDQQVCSIYRFTIRSDVERTLTATLNSESNSFSYLAYAVRDVTNNAWINLNPAGGTVENLGISKCGTAEDGVGDCYEINNNIKTYSTSPRAINSIFGYTNGGDLTTKTISNSDQIYDVVIFLKENNENQNSDQGKEYFGTIKVETTETGDSNRITGKAE